MKRHQEATEFKAWARKVGGLNAATVLIMQVLECSESKAMKLASGRYDRMPGASEQNALAALMQRPRDAIFPFVGAKGGKRAS